MRTNKRFAVSMVLVSGASAVAGAIGAGIFLQVNLGRRDLAVANREVVNMSYMALCSHRHGGPNSMLSGMEGTLDFGVCALWENMMALRKGERNAALELLRKVKSYRDLHPRTPSTQPGLKGAQEASDAILRGL